MSHSCRMRQPRDQWRDFDEFFLGYAHFYVDYGTAAEHFDKVVQQHPTWGVARMMRAIAKSHQGWLEYDPKMAREANQEVQMTTQSLPDTPFVHAMKLFAFSSVLYFDPELKQDPKFMSRPQRSLHGRSRLLPTTR